jgi:hypothetical protein
MDSLVVENNEIEDFQDALDGFPLIVWKDDALDCRNLLHLTISNSSLTSIQFLQTLGTLNYLNLSFNQITDVSSLATMAGLKVLDLSHNKICDLSPIQNFPELRILRLHHNLIECLDPIRDLTQLTELWISRNQIELSELFNLVLLKMLQHIFVESNPLESKPKHLDFLFAISPSLITVNGLAIRSLFPLVSSRGHPSDFFRTVDGRLMVTQSRSRLSDSQREFLLQYQLIPTKSSTLTHGSTDLILTSNATIGSTPEEAGLGHHLVASRSDDSNTKIKYFKAKKHSLPKKFVPSDVLSVNEEQELLTVEDAFDPQSAATVVRFGDGTSSPVALVLEKDGTGYAR